MRKKSQQVLELMKELVVESKANFTNSNLNIKLWKRFWQKISMYNKGKSYKDVMTLMFGSRKAEVLAHRKIYLQNLQKDHSI